jgi:hypothetical protein
MVAVTCRRASGHRALDRLEVLGGELELGGAECLGQLVSPPCPNAYAVIPTPSR